MSQEIDQLREKVSLLQRGAVSTRRLGLGILAISGVFAGFAVAEQDNVGKAFLVGATVIEASAGAFEISVASDYSRRAATLEGVVRQYELLLPPAHD